MNKATSPKPVIPLRSTLVEADVTRFGSLSPFVRCLFGDRIEPRLRGQLRFIFPTTKVWRWLIVVTGIIALAFTAKTTTYGAPLLVDEHPSEVAVQMQQQQLLQLFKDKIPGNNTMLAEQAARDFSDRLRASSPIAAENLKQGRMDDEELRSRVEVFLRDHPELTSGRLAVVEKSSDPRMRVASILRRFPQAAGSDAERLTLVDRFLEQLRERSRTASDALISGKMTDEEIQSRVSVFVADLHADPTASAVDPKVAAVDAVVESYLKANYGLPTERAGSLSVHGVVEAAGAKREFVIFRKRPSKLRMHIIDDGLVIGIIAYDGATAWRQELGRPARKLAGAEADAVVKISRFDDPLVDYQDRGSEVQLEEKTDKNVLRLHLREKNGAESIIEIDPKSFNQLVLRSRDLGGEWIETHFSDYRKTGVRNFAYVQEELKNGKTSSTTRITDVVADPGLLDQFFAMPLGSAFAYMDYMGGLAMIKAQQKQRPPMMSGKVPSTQQETVK